MSSSPAVSVVIPCFNLGEYLDEAVASVQAQTFQDFEILIVDDGSTDDATRRLLNDYQRPKTRVLRTENRGLSAARNFGVSHTTGQFLCMLDADDCLEPAYMERSVQALRDESSLGFVSHWLRTFGDESWEWTPQNCDMPALLKSNPINGAALFRREIWSAVGGFDETMRDGLEDWDFWIKVVEKGGRGRILPEYLFRYRRRQSSMSRLMMNDDGYARLHRKLIDKHPESYRQFLPMFLRESEQQASALLSHINDLETERYGWIGPTLTDYRDDLASLERKLARQEEERRAEAERQRLAEEHAALVEQQTALLNERTRLIDDNLRLQADRERLSADQARLQGSLAASDAQVRGAHAALSNAENALSSAQAEVQALRRSASWRVTQPLRSLYDFWLRVSGRGRR